MFPLLKAPPYPPYLLLQVHAAVLKGSRKNVVIKVLKPGVEDVLTTDMSFVYLVSRYLEFLQPELSRLSLTGGGGRLVAFWLMGDGPTRVTAFWVWAIPDGPVAIQ